MVTGRGAIITGFKLLNKHKSLLVIPMLWEIIKALGFYFGFGFNIPWPAQGGFYLNFALPKMWPTLDQIIARPLLGPDSSVILLNLAANKGLVVLGFLLGYILLDSLFRSVFLVLVKEKVRGAKVEGVKILKEAKGAFSQFVLLRAIVIIGALILALLERDLNWLPGLSLMLILLGNLALLFVDLAIVYQKVTVPQALGVNLYMLQTFPRPILELLIWGMVINGLVSIPINWSIGTLVGLIGSILVYSYVAIALALGILYIYTGYANPVDEEEMVGA